MATALADTSNYFARWWLKALASPTGNDILQEVAVTAVGKENAEDKHGADSTDGELEAKPFKRGYNAHISDDTPASLLRHQQIPFIVLLSASDDGRVINWALLMSYRQFDTERARRMGLGATETLPIRASERFKRLQQLDAARTKGTYVRSNALPLSVVDALKPGEYDIWINPDVIAAAGPKRERADFAVARRLAATNTGLSAATVVDARAYAAAAAAPAPAPEDAAVAEVAAAIDTITLA